MFAFVKVSELPAYLIFLVVAYLNLIGSGPLLISSADEAPVSKKLGELTRTFRRKRSDITSLLSAFINR